MRGRFAILTAVAAMVARAQTPPDSAAIVARMREAALAYTDRLQNFTCTQFLTRSAGDAPDGPHWKLLDRQESVLEYVSHKEHYVLLKVNGETLDPQKRIRRGPYFTPGGEFGSMLRKIFNPNAQAEFEWDHEENSGGARTCVFRYRVPLATTTEVIQADADRVPLGHHGMVWADCATGAVTQFRIETDIGEVVRGGHRIPVGSRLEVRYAPATVGSQEFLLPQAALESSLFGKTWTRSEIRFEQYRKYDANSTITFDGHF